MWVLTFEQIRILFKNPPGSSNRVYIIYMLNYTLKLFSRVWTYYRHLREIRVPTIPALLIIKMKSFTSGPSPWLTLKCDNLLGESCDCKVNTSSGLCSCKDDNSHRCTVGCGSQVSVKGDL